MLIVPKHDEPFSPMGILLPASSSQPHLCLSATVDAGAAVATAAVWQHQWFGSGITGILLQLDSEGVRERAQLTLGGKVLPPSPLCSAWTDSIL